MLKFPNTRYSKAWKQHAKPPPEMEYSRVINRKHWDEEKEEAISCIWGNYEVQCLLAALARPFSWKTDRAKAARKQHTSAAIVPSFRVATTAFARVLMSANIVAEWRDARLGLPFLFTVERVGRGRGERELGREKTRRRFHPPHRRAEGGSSPLVWKVVSGG